MGGVSGGKAGFWLGNGWWKRLQIHFRLDIYKSAHQLSSSSRRVPINDLHSSLFPHFLTGSVFAFQSMAPIQRNHLQSTTHKLKVTQMSPGRIWAPEFSARLRPKHIRHKAPATNSSRKRQIHFTLRQVGSKRWNEARRNRKRQKEIIKRVHWQWGNTAVCESLWTWWPPRQPYWWWQRGIEALPPAHHSNERWLHCWLKNQDFCLAQLKLGYPIWDHCICSRQCNQGPDGMHPGKFNECVLVLVLECEVQGTLCRFLGGEAWVHRQH